MGIGEWVTAIGLVIMIAGGIGIVVGKAMEVQRDARRWARGSNLRKIRKARK